MSAATYTAIGILLTLSIFIANVIYHTGRIAARVEGLEAWRINMRQDMHEVSDKLEEMNNRLKQLTTLMEERTSRRIFSGDTDRRESQNKGEG